MSSFSIHKAALEGQPGLVRSILSEDAKAINAKDDVGDPFLALVPSLGHVDTDRHCSCSFDWLRQLSLEPLLMPGRSYTTSLGGNHTIAQHDSALIGIFS